MSQDEKINYLSNNYAVTEQDLRSSLTLDYPEGTDVDFYLSYQAVMIGYTRENPKFLMQVLKNLSSIASMSMEKYVKALKQEASRLSEREEQVAYVTKKCGKFLTGIGLAMIECADTIDKAKAAIQ